eukprot:tig00000093_g3483.t1
MAASLIWGLGRAPPAQAYVAFKQHVVFLLEPGADPAAGPAGAPDGAAAAGRRRIAHCHVPGPVLRIDEAAARGALAGVCRALGIPVDPPSIGWHLLLRP